ncbi:hypothetical protein [Paracoccus sp. TOH]|uniref:hypothetical protein n=1 Tax=Paracoccus sp. TOH TaxID=1263728 RepID=UPI0025B1E08A|nr:hypothetical protein [Paracoccus sp. TOH]WJS83539.1 phage tail tape measure protein [Paracoccus sp. TOH]
MNASVGADERLVVMLEARISDFEKRMRQAEGTGTRTYQGLRRGSRSATRQMEQDMARSASSVRQSVASVTGSIGSMGKALAGGFLGGVAIGGMTELISSSRQVVAGIAEIGDEAKRAGLSMQAFQEWKFVADSNRISIDALVDGFKELSLRADELISTGAGPAAEAFGRLGYRAEDLKKKLKDPSALMLEIMQRLEGMDKAAQIRIADELFGGTGGEQFVQLLGQGENALRDTIARAHEAGAVLDDEMIAKAQDLDRRFRKLQTSAGNFFKQVVVDVATSLGVLADFEAHLDALFPNEGRGRQLIGDEGYETLEQNMAAAEELAGSLQGLNAQYDGLADAAGMTVPVLLETAAQLRMMGETGAADALQSLADEMQRAVAEFQNGETSAEDFTAKLVDVRDRADSAVQGLGEIDGISFAAVIGQLGSLGGTIAGVISLANSLKGALAAAAGTSADKANLDAMRQRQAAEKASMDSATALAEANDRFTASETARNTATREQIALEREMAEVRKRAKDAGAVLSDDQVRGFAEASLAGDAARASTGKGGGSSKSKRGRGGAGRQDEFTRGAEQIREQTAALEAEALVMAAVATSGKDYGDALEFARKKAELLHAAQQEGKAITPQLEAEIDKLAQAYVTAGLNAEDAAEKLQTIQDHSQRGRDALQDMFGAIIDGSMSGKEAFAQMLAEIGKVQLLKGVMGLLDAFTGNTGFFQGLGSMLSFDSGGYTGDGPRTGGLDGKGGRLAMVHPRETITDHHKGQQVPSASSGPQAVHVTVGVDPNSGNLTAFVDERAGAAAQAMGKTVSASIPGRIQQYQRNPRKR